jgi:hypothetical protein
VFCDQPNLTVRDAVSSAAFLKTVLWINAAAILAAVVAGLSKNGDPSRYFGEGRILTVFSCLQLLATAYYCWKTARSRGIDRASLKSAGTLWLILGAGFVFLAADDVLLIHENIDRKLHEMLNIQETAISDRLDDILIAIYAAIGLAILYAYRRELVAFRAIFPYLKIAFLLTALQVVLDALGNRPDVLSGLFDERGAVEAAVDWVDVAEGSAQFFAEALFLVGFFAATKIANRERKYFESAAQT